jgi:hypothetical protein
MDFLTRKLSPQALYGFFLLALLVYSYPLILADQFYNDDNWRSLFAGTGWGDEGRIFIEWFYNALSFSPAAPNLFPLPLLLAIVMMALALRSLVVHYFQSPTICECLVVLPLWFSPFFLQNLSYQYDGAIMALGLVAIIYAVVFRARFEVLQVWVPGMLIALALGFYQILINVFIGLCAVELIKDVNNGHSLRHVRLWACRRVAQLAAGSILYFFTAYRWMSDLRQTHLAFNAGWLAEIERRLVQVSSLVGLLSHEGTRWLCWTLSGLALLGYLMLVRRIFGRSEPAGHKWILLVISVAVFPVLAVLISGVALFMDYFNFGARTLMGFSVVLVLMFYLAHQLLTTRDRRAGLFLAVPLLAMLSFSYAYGRVESLQKQLESNVLYSLGYDITSREPLRKMDAIYMIAPKPVGWLPAANGSTALMPALSYVLSRDNSVLPEMLPRVGVTNVFPVSDEQLARQRISGLAPLVSNRFYDIYAFGEKAYVLIKNGADEPDKVPDLCQMTRLPSCHR